VYLSDFVVNFPENIFDEKKLNGFTFGRGRTRLRGYKIKKFAFSSRWRLSLVEGVCLSKSAPSTNVLPYHGQDLRKDTPLENGQHGGLNIFQRSEF